MNTYCKIESPFCLYFSINSFIRHLFTSMDKGLIQTGVSPSHAHLIIVISEFPGLTQSELSKKINLNPSTISRFLDKLIEKRLIYKIQNGREFYLYSTPKGIDTHKIILKSIKTIQSNFSTLLGKNFSKSLDMDIYKAIQGFTKQ